MHSPKPEVSVLLPVRQWRQTTYAAVESILSQSVTSLELLLIGQDNVLEIASRLPNDPRIRPIKRQQTGIVGALNTGLAHARGQFFARMDDDDISHPHRLASQLEHLQGRSGTELCGARVRFIGPTNNDVGVGNGNRRYAKWLNSLTLDADIREARYIECPLPHPTLMAHRDIWQRIGAYSQQDVPEDYDLVLRALLLGIRTGKPKDILLDWREHPQRLTYNDQRYRRDAFARCRAWAACQENSGLDLHSGRSVWLCGTGRHARQWHDSLEQHAVEIKGFVDLHRHGPERSKRNKPVISYEQLPSLRGNSLVISAVTQPQARQAISNYFAQQCWRAEHEFVLGG